MHKGFLDNFINWSSSEVLTLKTWMQELNATIKLLSTEVIYFIE